MDYDKNALKAGLFIFAALIAAAGVIVGIKGVDALFKPNNTYHATFLLTDDIGGLEEGDAVHVGGLASGKVKAINVVLGRDGKPNTIDVAFTLPQSIPLHADTRLEVQTPFVGQANLNISELGAGDALAAGGSITGNPAAFQQFLNNAPKIAAAFDQAGGLMGDIRTEIKPTFQKYNTLADTFTGAGQKADKALVTGDQALAEVRDLIGDTKTDWRALAKNVNGATATINQRLPGTMEKVDTFLDNTNGTVLTARKTLEDLKATTENTKAATATARSIITRNKSRIDNMIASLGDTSANLEGASAEIRRNPWRLLYKPTNNEANNLIVYDTTRQFANAANRLNVAAGAVKDAAQDPNLAPEDLTQLLQDLHSSFANYTEVEAKLWEAVK